MKCEDMLKALDLHLEGGAADEACAEFLRHMAGCERCRVVVDTIRNTVALYRESDTAVEIPEDCRRRLEQALRERWNKR
ncbi:MAG: zf-HC2 domain-containing protein [Deltaproteobacteria bacterium]|nr:zf-HC2 domain-containing protein [Deltaproteobacteria bacterium]